MTDDQHPPDPLPGEIDPIGPGTSVPETEQPPKSWDTDLEDTTPQAPEAPDPGEIDAQTIPEVM